jgi:LysM repeat protein
VAGDTLFSLAQRFGVTQQSIINLNPSVQTSNLMVGQMICIPNAPAPPVCPANSFAYTIMTGDSIASLAQKFGVTPQSILDANPGLNPANLMVGQQICIPGTMPSACTCEQNLAAANRNILLLRGESGAQIFNDMNYGTSTATTVATTVTTTELRFDAAPVTFTGDFTCQFTQGMAYAFFMNSAAGGQRGLVVRDNFGIWHTFEFRVPIM